jgi:hypothetical protein
LTDFTRTQGCPTCLSNKTEKMGYVYTRGGRRQRYRCRSCGTAFTFGPLLKETVDNATSEDKDVLHWEWQGGSDRSNGSDGGDRVDRSVVD